MFGLTVDVRYVIRCYFTHYSFEQIRMEYACIRSRTFNDRYYYYLLNWLALTFTSAPARVRGRKWRTVRGGSWNIRTAVVDGHSHSRRHSSNVFAHTAAERNKNHCPAVVVPSQSSTRQSSWTAVVFPTAERRFPLPAEPVIPNRLHALITRT